ncbi:MAG: cytochrome c biogenesis protein CcsA [Spirochaetes bacterium]|nr:cytochrome c biogenesis protein CcsA [Spirochaetota bacterium]
MSFIKDYFFTVFIVGGGLYTLSAISAAVRFKKIRNILFSAGTAAILFSLLLRIYYYHPLMCLFQEPYIISFFTGIMTVFLFLASRNSGLFVYTGTITLILTLFLIFMPGDIYVSFRQTNSLFAHVYSFFSSFARACYLCAGAIAVRCIIKYREADTLRFSDNSIIANIIIAGYCLHSIGMFSGGLWSYAGWGTPVQWQSHIFLGMAGVWFFYSWFLHVKLSVNNRKPVLTYAALAGGILTFIFSYLPDTGKFNIPGIFQ